MTLVGAIIKKAKSKNVKRKKYTSPPPELDQEDALKDKIKRPVYKYAHVRGVVDSGPPRYDAERLSRHLPEWRRRILALYRQNIQLLTSIKLAHYNRGRVDSRWSKLPSGSRQYYERRASFCRRLQADNRALYQRILDTRACVISTAELRRSWARNRRQIVEGALAPFVLFEPVPRELLEDDAFAPPPGVRRPRVRLWLRARGGAALGALRVELFSETCPRTAGLFLQLLAGDGCGFSYINTCFFRKVPGLYWSGGDVVYDNGCGCYAQPGRRAPIGAENYHFSHSMPGLLSMRVTKDDEMCGIFNITFKPLPQFDLRSVVFGRIIRPCRTFSALRRLGSALSPRPVIELAAATLI